MDSPLYVGVSGFMSAAEVRSALEAFPACGRKLMVGALASSKTLCGVPNKYPRRYPKREDIAGIFVDDPRALNLVHVGLDEVHTWPFDIFREAMKAGGSLCHGLQINAPWPVDPYWAGALSARLKGLRHDFPTARIVFQLRPGPEGPWKVATRACYVVGSGLAFGADDVLIDASGGTGRSIDAELVTDIVTMIREHAQNIGYGPAGIGIAGGLCAKTLPAIQRLLVDEGLLSIAAEGRLRDDAEGGGNLDLAKVLAYLVAAGELLESRAP